MSQVTLYSVQDIATRVGVDVAFVERLVDLGVITVHPNSGQAFACEVTIRVGKFVRLQRDLGLNSEGAALVLDLLDRIDHLESQLRHYESR
jgi:MerR family transcriptional regulator/heat shock protein HspR